MATLGLIEYQDASPEVRAVYDDIMAVRARPTGSTISGRRSRTIRPRLGAPGKSIKQIMAPGALDPLTKEMLYVAVSVTNSAAIASHRTRRRRAARA